MQLDESAPVTSPARAGQGRGCSGGRQTLARTEESWSGTLPRLLPGMMWRSLEKTLESWLTHLKAEAGARSGG